MKVAIGSCALLLALTISQAHCQGQDSQQAAAASATLPVGDATASGDAQAAAAAAPAPSAPGETAPDAPKTPSTAPSKDGSMGNTPQVLYPNLQGSYYNTVPVPTDNYPAGQYPNGTNQEAPYPNNPYPAGSYRVDPSQGGNDGSSNQNPQDAPVTQATLDAKIAALEARLSDLITKSLTNCKMEISSQTASALGNLVDGNQVDSNVAVKLASKTPVKTPNTADEPTVAKRLYLTVVPKKVAINSYKTVVVNMTRTEMTRVCIDGRVEYQTREVETPIEVCVPCKVDVIVDEPVYKELGVAIK